MATTIDESRPGELLTSEQAARALGIEPATLSVWRCVKRYDLPFVKVGRAVRYRREHIEQFIASRTVGASTPAVAN